MPRTISAYVNVTITDYDESVKNHVVELMKDSLREQTTEYILEDSWGIAENKRTLYKNEDGTLEIQGPEQSEISDTREILEVMTVVVTAKVV